MPSLKEMLAARSAPASAKPGPAQTPAAPAPSAAPKVRADQPDTPPPVALADEPRQLGNREKGVDVPFEFASEMPSEAARQWLQARQTPATQLGIYVEPEESSDHAWIAVANPTMPGKLIFLFRLPLLTATDQGVPF